LFVTLEAGSQRVRIGEQVRVEIGPTREWHVRVCSCTKGNGRARVRVDELPKAAHGHRERVQREVEHRNIRFRRFVSGGRTDGVGVTDGSAVGTKMQHAALYADRLATASSRAHEPPCAGGPFRREFGHRRSAGKPGLKVGAHSGAAARAPGGAAVATRAAGGPRAALSAAPGHTGSALAADPGAAVATLSGNPGAAAAPPNTAGATGATNAAGPCARTTGTADRSADPALAALTRREAADAGSGAPTSAWASAC
jgi:hypothetical protein